MRQRVCRVFSLEPLLPGLELLPCTTPVVIGDVVYERFITDCNINDLLALIGQIKDNPASIISRVSLLK